MHPFYYYPNYGFFPPFYPSFHGFPQPTQPQLPQPYPLVLPSPQPHLVESVHRPQQSLMKGEKVKVQTPVVQERPRRKVQNEHKEKTNSHSDLISLDNRNILPNMNNVILSYIRRINRSGNTVEKVMKAYIGEQEDLNKKMKQFYAYQNYLKNNVNDYIIREAIKAVMDYTNPSLSSFSIKDQRLFNKIFRVVVRKYLEEDYLSIIMTTGMDKVKRADHMKVRRFMLKMLKQ